MMIETWSLKDSFLIFLQTSSPDMSGSIKSRSTRSGTFFPISLIAPRPSAAELTLYPSDFKLNSRVVLRSGSSSTIKTFFAMS